MPKKYAPDERERAVRMVREQAPECGSVTGACRVVSGRLGISIETLRNWCRQARVDAGDAPGTTTQENEQIRALKLKVRRLEEDNEILRRAATFFAGELDPRRRG